MSAIEFDPFGAHVTAAAGMIYTSPTTLRMHAEDGGKTGPIRGGIPLIGPRFNERAPELFPDEPKHGTLRRAEWTIEQHTDTTLHATLAHGGMSYRFELDLVDPATSNDPALDGKKVRAIMNAQLDATNTSDAPLPLQLGFHPYFAVEETLNAKVEGVAGKQLTNFRTPAPYVQHTQPADEDVLSFSESGCDLGVKDTTMLTLFDAQAGTRLTVTSQACDTFVVWNPGAADAEAMEDLPDEGWHHFVCVEPMIHGPEGKGVQVAPGKTVSLDMRVVLTEL